MPVGLIDNENNHLFILLRVFSQRICAHPDVCTADFGAHKVLLLVFDFLCSGSNEITIYNQRASVA